MANEVFRTLSNIQIPTGATFQKGGSDAKMLVGSTSVVLGTGSAHSSVSFSDIGGPQGLVATLTCAPGDVLSINANIVSSNAGTGNESYARVRIVEAGVNVDPTGATINTSGSVSPVHRGRNIIYNVASGGALVVKGQAASNVTLTVWGVTGADKSILNVLQFR